MLRKTSLISVSTVILEKLKMDFFYTEILLIVLNEFGTFQAYRYV